MFLKIIISLALSSVILLASSLDIYSDKSFYTYEPKDTFIGFNTRISAKDATQTLELIRKSSCTNKGISCKEHTKIQALHVSHSQLIKEQEILQTLVAQYQPQVVLDADKAIKTASKIASRMAKLEQESLQIESDIKSSVAKFSKYAPSKEAIYFSKKPDSKVTLTINNGLYFHSEYILNIDKSTLQHTILLSNSSGIDIVADEAKLFAKSAGYINTPIKFYPRKIRIQQPQKKRVMSNDAVMMSMQSVAAPAPVGYRKPKALHVSQKETRTYQIKNLILPSDGSQKNIPVNSENLNINSTLTWHPYNSSYVYQTASFTPKQTIESRKWKVLRGGELIENAPVRKDGKKILINTAIDYDLEVTRKTINEFSEDKGIFSSNRVKKDGFILTLTNRSDRSKSVIITERIPLSTQEEITVSLDKLNTPHSYNKKSGKLTINAKIEPKESKKIEITYSIIYPKDSVIYY
jgi:hypothetical protein